MSEPVVCPFCAGSIEAGVAECPACHRSLENRNPRGALPVGTVLAGRYTLGEFVYADGEGILYRGVENNGGVHVTIKEYLPVTLSADRSPDGALRPKAGSEVLFKTTRMDFADLYRAIMRVTPATGLEAVLDVVEANNTVYAVMENPGGIPLSKYLETMGGVMDPAEARSMLQPVFEGVAAMHTAGLVHRGISPENIRVLENGRARLTGYATIGLRTAGCGLRAQLYEGYSAPEQYSSAEFEGRYTDEYGLAAVFYRMVCGRAPVPAGQRLVADSNPPARTIEPTVPSYLSRVLERGLLLKPADRIQTVSELFSGLSSPDAARSILESDRQTGGRPAEEGTARRQMNGVVAGLLLLTAVLALLLIWFGLGRRHGGEADSQSAASTAATPEPEKMPDFRGLTYSQVLDNQSYSGRFLFYITEQYSNDQPVGVILEQTPEAGALITGEAVNVDLVVSKGPELVPMPNIIGFTQAGAEEELRKAGLNGSFYMMNNDGSYASGCVVKCDAEPGDQLKAGSTVAVYIAADRDVVVQATPEPSPTPDTPAPSATPGVEEDLN